MARGADGQVARLRARAVCAVVQDGGEEMLEGQRGVIQGGDADVVPDEGEPKDCTTCISTPVIDLTVQADMQGRIGKDAPIRPKPLMPTAGTGAGTAMGTAHQHWTVTRAKIR